MRISCSKDTFSSGLSCFFFFWPLNEIPFNNNTSFNFHSDFGRLTHTADAKMHVWLRSRKYCGVLSKETAKFSSLLAYIPTVRISTGLSLSLSSWFLVPTSRAHFQRILSSNQARESRRPSPMPKGMRIRRAELSRCGCTDFCSEGSSCVPEMYRNPPAETASTH